jgi:hypothetical protein
MRPLEYRPEPAQRTPEQNDLLALAFDQYQRYTAVTQVADFIRTGLTMPRLRVLDVGGFFCTKGGDKFLPLVRFLPDDEVTIADLAVESMAHYVVADGRSLPFASQAFDLVVSCDTLEHVPPAGRTAFIDELLRVMGRCLVLIAPTDGESTRLAEHLLTEHIKAQGLSHRQLQEHLDLGLPDASAVRDLLSDRGVDFFDLGDGYLHHWLLMMLIKHTPGYPPGFYEDLDRYYNRHFSASDRREPAYRRVFVAVWPGDRKWLPVLADRLAPAGPSTASPGLDLVQEFIRGLNLHRTAALTEALSASERHLSDLQARLAAQSAENAALRQTVASFERGRFVRFMRFVDLWRRRLGL